MLLLRPVTAGHFAAYGVGFEEQVSSLFQAPPVIQTRRDGVAPSTPREQSVVMAKTFGGPDAVGPSSHIIGDPKRLQSPQTRRRSLAGEYYFTAHAGF